MRTQSVLNERAESKEMRVLQNEESVIENELKEKENAGTKREIRSLPSGIIWCGLARERLGNGSQGQGGEERVLFGCPITSPVWSHKKINSLGWRWN